LLRGGSLSPLILTPEPIHPHLSCFRIMNHPIALLRICS